MISYGAIWLKSLSKLSFWLTLNFPALWTDSQVFPLTNLNFLELVCYQMLCIGLSFWSFLNGVKHTLTLFGSSALTSAHSEKMMLQKLFFSFRYFLQQFYQKFFADFFSWLDDYVRPQWTRFCQGWIWMIWHNEVYTKNLCKNFENFNWSVQEVLNVVESMKLSKMNWISQCYVWSLKVDQ